MTKRARVAVAVLVLLVAALASGCSAGGRAQPSTVTVFAAASLSRAFTDLGTTFEANHPGTKVSFSFAGSSDLAQQLAAGAPADVFAAADENTMDRAVHSGRITDRPQVFATNTLTIITAPGNPHQVKSLADLASPSMRVVVCAPQVPCGAATRRAAATAHVSVRAVSEEAAVTDVVAKVVSGEADAGVVYVTDAAAAGTRVAAVSFPEASSAVNTYPIAAVADSRHAELARGFVALVTGTSGRATLAGAGFGPP